MHIVRKLGLWTANGLLRSTLFLLAFVSAVVMLLGTPTHIKAALKTSNVYSSAVQSLLDQAKKSTESSSNSDVPINDPVIQQAATSAFSPSFLESSTETIIDGTYHWLDGKTPRPDFQVDVSVAKQNFITAVANYAGQRVTGLAVCNRQQLLALQGQDINPFTVPCRPPGTNVPAEQQKLINQLSSNADFLPNTTISASSLPKDEQGQTAFDKAQNAPKAYQFSKSSPWLLATISVLLALAVLFLHETKRRGARSLGITFLSIGLILGLSTLLISWALHKALAPTGNLGKSLQANALQLSMIKVIDTLGQFFSRRLLWFAVGYVVFGGALLFILKFVWKEPKPTSPTETPSSTK